MGRETYVWCPVAGAVVEKWRAAAFRGDNGAPPLLDRPHVLGVMPETQHPIDGRHYDSRERYEAVTRRHGGIEVGKREMARMIERGNPQYDPRPGVRAAIKQALERHGF